MRIWIHPKHRLYVVIGAAALVLLLLYLLRGLAIPLVVTLVLTWAFGQLAMVIGAGLLIWHVVRYLRDGFWNALSVLDIFRLTPEMAFHVNRALADWRGVERILDSTAAWLALLVVGGTSALIFKGLNDYLSALANGVLEWLKSFLGLGKKR